MFYSVLLLCSIVFGTTMGAYYCTMEYRIHANLPLVTADCVCPACGHTLKLYHQIPVISFILLKGKCHFCHSPISARYPIIESLFFAYYGLTFYIFRKYPFIYLSLWYAFVTILLLFRCRKHYHASALRKGLLIMAGYHLVIGVLYIVLYAAEAM